MASVSADQRMAGLPQMGSGPRVEPVDVHGGGDALTAGIVAGLSRGDDLPAALRLGAAAASLNVARRGLATGRRQDIEQVAEQVHVFPYPTDSADSARVPSASSP